MGSPRFPKGTVPTEGALNTELGLFHPSTVVVGGARPRPPQGGECLPRGCSTAAAEAGGNHPHGIPAPGSGPPNRPASAGPLLKTMLPRHRQALAPRMPCFILEPMPQALHHSTALWHCIMVMHYRTAPRQCCAGLRHAKPFLKGQVCLELPPHLGLVNVAVGTSASTTSNGG